MPVSSPSPFKFLSPYTAADQDIFFGREEEIESLYRMIFQTNLILVYGQSGTGKTSLIQCGLASRLAPTDWLEVQVRRKQDINQSLNLALSKAAQTPLSGDMSLPEKVESLFLDYFRPVFLVFDQFEELFILGDEKEQNAFFAQIKALSEANLNCKLIFVMREEYLAHLYRFEQYVPQLFDKRLRVEAMSAANARRVILGSCERMGIRIDSPDDTVKRILDNISSGKAGIQLPYLQVYMDRLYQEAIKAGATP